jgi:hypothetical protein
MEDKLSFCPLFIIDVTILLLVDKGLDHLLYYCLLLSKYTNFHLIYIKFQITSIEQQLLYEQWVFIEFLDCILLHLQELMAHPNVF